VSVSCLVFSFVIITLLVGVDGGNSEGRPDGGSDAI